MTDRTPAGHGSVKRPARLTKGSARVWGWVAGTIAFVMPWAVIGAKARSSASTETAAAAAPQPRPVVIIRRITKRIIVQQKAPTPTPQVRYVTVGGGSSGGSSGSSGGGGSAPPPPPPASTGGS